MQAERTGTVVIGAGIVGLAVAERLSRKSGDIVVVERHESFGRETSSRNSQVIHAGLYYPEGSYKALYCVEGNPMLYEFCRRHGIEARRTGKLVPGIDDDEVAVVHDRFRLGTANGAKGLRLLSRAEREAYLPGVRCTETMLSETTGIVDAHSVMAALERLAESRGAVFAYASTAKSIEFNGGTWRVSISDADGMDIAVDCDCIINSAGLEADTVASTCGFSPEAYGCSQTPAKGEYFRVSERHRGHVNILVYPAVTASMDATIEKGVHLVQELDGGMRIGPNTIIGETDYEVDPDHLIPFWRQMNRYLPWLEKEDLRPESAGIRPVRQGAGDDKHDQDYYIREESQNGFPGLINLIGMNSPALTSCLAIANHVAELAV